MSFFANKYVIAGIRMAEIIALTILPALSYAAIAYVTILTMNPRAASAKISTKPIFLCAKSKGEYSGFFSLKSYEKGRNI